MPRVCTVCASPDRKKIEKALLAGRPDLAIARSFAISRDAIRRHKKTCISNEIHSKKQELADRLLDEIGELHGIVRCTLTTAQKQKDGRLALAAVGEARKNLELLAKLTGQFNPERDEESEKPMLTWEQFLEIYLRSRGGAGGR